MVFVATDPTGALWLAGNFWGSNTTIDGGGIAPYNPVAQGNVDAYLVKMASDAATIHGKLFSDFNANGLDDQDIKAPPAVTVFLDANNNGVLDTGEVRTTTDAAGGFLFRYLTPGTYRVVVIPPSGWSSTNGVAHAVTVGAGQFRSSDFGLTTGNQSVSYAGKGGNLRDSNPNAGPVEFKIRINQSFNVWDVDVLLDITHPRVGDLGVALIAPDGTFRYLIMAPGYTAAPVANLSNVRMDDGATRPMGPSPAPYTGNYRPYYSLDAFDGRQAKGTWTLRIIDYTAGQTGKLNSWSLVFNRLTSGALKAAAAVPGVGSVSGVAPLAEAQARRVLDAAINLWRGRKLDAVTQARLRGVAVRIADLPGRPLGRWDGATLTLDRDAAGRGWFIDATPDRSEEFVRRNGVLKARRGSKAAGRYDLLTALAHELGHALGLGHDDHGTMAARLRPGVRALPDAGPARSLALRGLRR